VRLVTYIGLVVRRVWSKRAILLGSFLGATLVTALLVVLPLYEASVQAVDLRFTLTNAPSGDVDLVAFTSTGPYDAEAAAGYRSIVAAAWENHVDPWYPTYSERTESREFVVIPIDLGVDWIGLGEEWKEEITRLRLEGVDEEELPPPPYPQPPPEATQVRIITAPDIADRLEVVDGEWPGVVSGLSEDPAAPLRIVIGAELATTIQRGPGDRFVLKPFANFPDIFEVVEVAAVVEPVDRSDPLWGLSNPSMRVFLPQGTFDAWTRPLRISPDDDPWGRGARGFDNTSASQRWFTVFDRDSLDLQEVDLVQDRIVAYGSELSRESGGALASNTLLPILLDRFTTRSVVIGGPILAILALGVGGALYFLVYTAALTLEREGPEIALLRTRGASSWQTVGIHLAQSLAIAVVAAIAAPYVARLLVAITGRVPPLSDLTAGSALEVSQVRSIRPFVIGGAAATFVSMGLAILPVARRSVLELRSLSARPTRSSVWQRYNLDLFAIALSLVVLFQLAQRGFINFAEDGATLDPLAIGFPALLLFTGALVLLRVFPWLLRGVGWVMNKSRSMSLSLPGWHLGRNPVPYGRLALLVWLTTGLGAFALTYANTLDQSFNDRASFAAGADVRVISENAGYLDVPDGDLGTPVLRSAGSPRRSTREAEVLAVRPAEFAAVTEWRRDFGDGSPEEVFGALRSDGVVPDAGVELPGGVTALRFEGIVVPRSLFLEDRLGDDAESQNLRVLVKVFDARGRVWTMVAGSDLVDTGWSSVEIDLTSGRNLDYVSPPEPPLSLHALWFERSDQTSGNTVDGEVVLNAGLWAITPSGEAPVDYLEELVPEGGLSVQRDTPARFALDVRYSQLPPDAPEPTAEELEQSPYNRDGTTTRLTITGSRRAASPDVPALRRPPDPVSVLLDSEAAGIAGLTPGESAAFTVEGEVFDGVFRGYVGEVPTMSDGTKEGNMIVDFDGINPWLNGEVSWSYRGNLSRIIDPGELWIATDDTDAALQFVSSQLGDDPDDFVSIAGAASDFAGRPVQVGLVAILFVGAVTSVVLALAGVTGYVLLAVSRRAREMGVLRALGFQRRGVAATFAVEQLVVLGLGAVIGVVGGVALMRTMIPFLQLGETAEDIEPPIVLAIDTATLGLYVAVVAALMIVSVIWATRRVSARRMSEVLREVER
jgi:hypothetical protein